MWRFTSTTFNFVSIYLIVNQIISETNYYPVVNEVNDSLETINNSTFLKNIFLENDFLKRFLTSIYFTPIEIKLAPIWYKQATLNIPRIAIYQQYDTLQCWFINSEDCFTCCPQSMDISIKKQVYSTS